MNSIDDLYKFLYNTLIEISNGEVITIHYLIGPKWKVCNHYDTVLIADNAIKYLKNRSEFIKNLKCKDQNYYNKIMKMFNIILDIAKSKKHSWDHGWFNKKYYYYADDTVYKAQKCLKIINDCI